MKTEPAHAAIDRHSQTSEQPMATIDNTQTAFESRVTWFDCLVPSHESLRRSAAMRPAANGHVSITIRERLTSRTASVSWSDSQLGCLAEQVWSLGRARGRCLLHQRRAHQARRSRLPAVKDVTTRHQRTLGHRRTSRARCAARGVKHETSRGAACRATSGLSGARVAPARRLRIPRLTRHTSWPARASANASRIPV